MAEKIPGWLQRVLMPQIGEVKGELKAMNARMEGDFKVLHSEIMRVEETLGTKIDELDKRMDVTRRLAAVEEQVRELRAKA
jgi:predicted transcriptional regulator with HTH domain